MTNTANCSSPTGRGQAGRAASVFVRFQPNEFWMLTLYSKARQENAPAHILKRLKELFEHD